MIDDEKSYSEKVHWNPMNELHKFDNVYYETRDKQGRLHSFNNKPAFVAGSKTSINKIMISPYELDNFYNECKALYREEEELDANKKCILKKVADNKCKIWYKHGIVHRDGDEPAIKMRVGPEINKSLVWYKNGVITRNNDKPALIVKIRTICLNDNEPFYMYKWYHNGIIHRKHLPAIVILHHNKRPYIMMWLLYGELCSNNSLTEPNYMSIEYDCNGEVVEILYGAPHSETSYNMITYTPHRTFYKWIVQPILTKHWRSNILVEIAVAYHRLTGPAIIAKDKNDKTMSASFYIYGFNMQQCF